MIQKQLLSVSTKFPFESPCPYSACYFHPHMRDILAAGFFHFSCGCQLAAVLAQTNADAFDFRFYHLFLTYLFELTWVYPHFSSHTGIFVTVCQSGLCHFSLLFPLMKGRLKAQLSQGLNR